MQCDACKRDDVFPRINLEKFSFTTYDDILDQYIKVDFFICTNCQQTFLEIISLGYYQKWNTERKIFEDVDENHPLWKICEILSQNEKK